MILEQIAKQLALPVPFLEKLAKTASFRYKEYTIPKKTGGERTIHHPARELKLVQNWLLQNVFVTLPTHVAATAYAKGSTIRRNAEIHVANNYLLRVDFRNFFPSLKGTDVMAALRGNQNTAAGAGVTAQDIDFMRKILCRFDSLTIGAPTSPQLSNAIMFEFDTAWSEIAQNLDVAYTRYADDLYFSTNQPNILSEVLERLRESLKEGTTPTLQINNKKTAFSSRKRKRLAAGLVLTCDRKISIGRSKKRLLKSLVWKLVQKQLAPDEIASLRGWLAYLRSVEPSFVFSLQQKYDLDFDDNQTWEN